MFYCILICNRLHFIHKGTGDNKDVKLREWPVFKRATSQLPKMIRLLIGSASRARFEQHLVTALAVSRVIRPQRWPRPRVASIFQTRARVPVLFQNMIRAAEPNSDEPNARNTLDILPRIINPVVNNELILSWIWNRSLNCSIRSLPIRK